MRIIERSNVFDGDFKRLKSTLHHCKDIDALLAAIVVRLLDDEALPESNRDQALGANWMGYRECYLKPSVTLIYRKRDAKTLRLARLGKHFGERDRSFRSLVNVDLGERDRDISDDAAYC